MSHRVVMDHLGRSIRVPTVPTRIICLCPSLTETLAVIGVGDRLVGRTRFCIHPMPELKSVTRVGGTKEVKYDRIHALEPDLIICEKEENTREIVETLSQRYPVFVTEIQGIDRAIAMVEDLGELIGLGQEGRDLRANLSAARKQVAPMEGNLRAAYMIWKDPWMGAGRDTFIDEMLNEMGLTNILRDMSGRYPEISLEALISIRPELILLSSEPYPFKEEHLKSLKAVLPHSHIELVDGEMFSWYGSHMIEGFSYIQELARTWERLLSH
ncbi:helical backbone metal receptor [Pontibacter sp. G13]|uniref:ABC transporter substrate-binding protein n=1 Tax=Pontibacter sp. G13 TaxID=3074898 RepID=UPI00288A19A1|nr:helical backbone metal receptor [Pontibacter sp. G13]WNJ18978.1 helical backbone metal receptor [Pontibacter sp. G13]